MVPILAQFPASAGTETGQDFGRGEGGNDGSKWVPPTPPQLRTVSSQIFRRVRSKVSQEVTGGEMAPYSGTKLALLRRHRKAHTVLTSANDTPD